MTTVQSKLGDELERRRNDLGIEYPALSQRSGVSIATVKRVLGGGYRRASFGHVEAIAAALGVDVHGRARIDADTMRLRQARAKAERLVAQVQATSALEAQAVDADHVRRMIDRTARDLLRSNRRLWA